MENRPNLDSLNISSCEKKLSELLTNVDVYAADHVLWVDYVDEIHLTPVPVKMTPGQWEDLNRDRIKFALEPFTKGSGKVGPLAAQDRVYLRDLCSAIRSRIEGDLI